MDGSRRSDMKNELPGLYLAAGDRVDLPGCRRLGAYAVKAMPGALVSVTETAEGWFGVDGILTGVDRYDNESDAEAALRLYRHEGVDALHELTGFFTLLLIEKAAHRAWLISDLMASRPYYIYAHAGKASISPDASFPRRLGWPATLDRQVLYQMFRINHPLGGRCLAREIERIRPFAHYRIAPDGSVARSEPARIEQAPDPRLTLDEAADQMHETAARAVGSILAHPVTGTRSLELPLTAGYDSRHLLGELLALGRPPDRIRHIRVDEADYTPVEMMCRDLGLDLRAARFGDLDQAALVRAWLLGSAGQVHLHQLYLYGLGCETGPQPVVGLTAYLSGLLFSYTPLGTPLNRRRYTRTSLRLLFPDCTRLAREFDERIDKEISRFAGEPAFRLLAVDAVNRSPRYAGAAFAGLGDRALYFAPAADAATWEWFCRVPASLAWRQKARIRLFERHFPDLGRFPARDGSPLVRMRPECKIPPNLRTPGGSRWNRRARNPVPPTPHAWLRAHPTLRGLVERVVTESKLCQDGEIPHAAVRMLWTGQRHGAFAGWPLMSLATTEAAYRILIRGEDPDNTADWLTGRG